MKLAKKKTSVLLCPRFTEPKKTFCLDKKKKYLKKNWDQKNFTPVIEENVIKIDEKKENE